jgi:hypothetical protein
VHSFAGTCHCGALSFDYQTALPPARWSVRACQCGFCRAHAAATTSDPSGRLIFEVAEHATLQHYRFGLRTADFLVCRRCGVYLGAQIQTAHGSFGIINTLALTPPAVELPLAVVADYGSESTPQRAARREQKWTPLEKLI